jgi:hypothetical protein
MPRRPLPTIGSITVPVRTPCAGSGDDFDRYGNLLAQPVLCTLRPFMQSDVYTITEAFKEGNDSLLEILLDVRDICTSLKSPAPSADSDEIASLRSEITSLKAEVRKLHASTPSPTSSADTEETASLRREIASLTAEVRELRTLISTPTPPATSRPHKRVGRQRTPPPRPTPPPTEKGLMFSPPRAAKGKRRRSASEPPKAPNGETRSQPKGKKTRQASPVGDSALADTPWTLNEDQAGPTAGLTKHPDRPSTPHLLPPPRAEGGPRWVRRRPAESPNVGRAGLGCGDFRRGASPEEGPSGRRNERPAEPLSKW